MKFQHTNTYAAPIDRVRTMLHDPAFREQVAARTGALSCQAAYGGGKLLVTEEQAVAGVPSFAKRFVGESTKVIHTELWDDAGTSATITLDTPGKPTRIVGRITLAEADGATTHAYDLDVTASVPLVGGRLEKLVAELTTAGLVTEGQVGAEWLASGGLGTAR